MSYFVNYLNFFLFNKNQVLTVSGGVSIGFAEPFGVLVSIDLDSYLNKKDE